MGSLEKLRTIIREEVTRAIRSEMSKILKENQQSPSKGVKNVIKEMGKSKIPMTLNTEETYKMPKDFRFSSSDHLNSLLTETAMAMGQDSSMSFTSDDVDAFSYFQPKEAEVSDVNAMLSTARPSSNLETIQINTVPDYSQLMKNLKDKGAI